MTAYEVPCTRDLLGEVPGGYNTIPATYDCIDCGTNTAPGSHAREEIRQLHAAGLEAKFIHGETTEIYMVRDRIWQAAGLEEWSGYVCIGCLEKRLGRQLRPKDFTDHVFNTLPCTPRLQKRRGGVRKRGLLEAA
jgi:hypothetical protein